jgi:hypothetical protein
MIINKSNIRYIKINDKKIYNKIEKKIHRKKMNLNESNLKEVYINKNKYMIIKILGYGTIG